MKKYFRIFIFFILLSCSTLIGATLWQEPKVNEQEASVLELAESYRKQQVPNLAAAELRKNINENTSAALPFALGVILLEQEKYHEAVEAFSDALARMPNFHRCRLLIARTLMNVEDYHAASVHLTVLTAAPSTELAEIWHLLGLCHLKNKQLQAAETALRMALTLEPGRPGLGQTLLQTLILQGDAEEIRRSADALRRDNPNERDYWSALAASEAKEQNISRLIVILECMNRLNMLDAQETAVLASLYLQEKMFDESLARLQKHQPETYNPATLLMLAEGFASFEKIEQAQKILNHISDRTIEMSSDEKTRLALLQSTFAQKENNHKAAIDILNNQLKNNPYDVTLLIRLGELLSEHGETQKAINNLETALRHSETIQHRAHILRSIAILRIRLQEYNSAIELLEEAQKIIPDENSARTIEQLKRLTAK